MQIREVSFGDVECLRECIAALSKYHNEVSVNFKGVYPARPYEKTLEILAESLRSGEARIAAFIVAEKIAGFCKVDFHGQQGKLDYVVLLPEYRGQGYGKVLMDWAMEQFKANGVRRVEVKVVYGNPAVHLYEKYGFKINAQLLWCNVE